jgi:Na+-translocating ferredoxin:NAD+ oxidoreductase RNF subunit RnfB
LQTASGCYAHAKQFNATAANFASCAPGLSRPIRDIGRKVIGCEAGQSLPGA